VLFLLKPQLVYQPHNRVWTLRGALVVILRGFPRPLLLLLQVLCHRVFRVEFHLVFLLLNHLNRLVVARPLILLQAHPEHL
jgi:hypothetical protein